MANDIKKTPEEIKAAEKAEQNEFVRSMVKGIIDEALPVAMMAAAQVQRGPAPVASKYPAASQCGECGQLLIACKEQHAYLLVQPSSERMYRSFPGITTNNVCYKSPWGVKICVPKENDILYRVRAWEQSEDDLRNGREIQHNSGTISPQPGRSQVQQADHAGFSGAR